MNPFDEYRKIYIAACFIAAVIYAFALGGSFLLWENVPASLGENLPASPRIADRILFCIANGLIFGGILCLAGIILWNIFRFAIPANYNSKYQFIFISTLAVLTGLLITAAESFAIYLCFPSMFGFFVHSIPVRLFVTLLFFIIIRLLYLFYHENSRNIKKAYGEASGEKGFPESAIPEKTILENAIQEPSNTAKSPIDRITVRKGQKIIIIPIDEIFFIKADGDYISINTAKGFWLKEQTMKSAEEMLPIDRFVRIHRSYIVNINFISRIERYGEKQQIVMHNNEKIKVSAARYQVLKQVLDL